MGANKASYFTFHRFLSPFRTDKNGGENRRNAFYRSILSFFQKEQVSKGGLFPSFSH